MDIATQLSDNEEFCTECGEFVSELNTVTGWCDPCSVKSGWVTPSCPGCGRESSNGQFCSRCYYIKWLERNADAIETVMAVRVVSVRVAKKIVEADNRPICQSCHDPINRGQKGRHFFCTKKPECVKAHNAYSYHIRHKPHREALELAVTASLIYKLTANISLKDNRE